MSGGPQHRCGFCGFGSGDYHEVARHVRERHAAEMASRGFAESGPAVDLGGVAGMLHEAVEKARREGMEAALEAVNLRLDEAEREWHSAGEGSAVERHAAGMVDGLEAALSAVEREMEERWPGLR